ncbi:MAG: 50S ribosomal protein L25 [Actinomycetota bacterium]
MEVTIKAEARSESGKGPARRARAAGKLPGVLYGRSTPPLPLLVDVRELLQALHTEAGANVLINLELDGAANHLTMLREIQRHPVRGGLVHADFVTVARDVKIHADVPIHLVGIAQGVRAGGVIEHHLWELEVEALPGDLPPAIEVDISSLLIGEHLRVAQVAPPRGVEILSPPEGIITSVVEPQVMQLPAEAVAEGAPAEAAPAPEEGE